MRPAVVVAGWAALNAALTLLLLFFGENPLFVGMYAGAVLITLAVAAVVYLAVRAPGERLRLATGSGSTVYVALAALLAGFSLMSTAWFAYLAALALLLAGVRVRRERLPAGTEPAPTPVPSAPPRRFGVPDRGPWRVVTGLGRVAVLTAAAARALSSLRGRSGRRR